MKLQKLKSGFTLIELLVVITIIGILATGAVSVYTSQIQKARDSTRITSLSALRSSVEQVYQDAAEYPRANTFSTQVRVYMEALPKDPKHSQPCNWASIDCWYAYIAWPDANNIEYGNYELSTGFENSWNVSSRALTDGWNDSLRLEMWLRTGTNTTAVASGWITTVAIWSCTIAWAVATVGTGLIVINWNPSTAVLQCG